MAEPLPFLELEQKSEFGSKLFGEIHRSASVSISKKQTKQNCYQQEQQNPVKLLLQ